MLVDVSREGNAALLVAPSAVPLLVCEFPLSGSGCVAGRLPPELPTDQSVLVQRECDSCNLPAIVAMSALEAYRALKVVLTKD